MDSRIGTEQSAERQTAADGLSPARTADGAGDQSLWTAFAEASTVEAFCSAWLALQCRQISGVRGGMVLLGAADR